MLLSARYSATNPSLLPPNEDPRREEAREREQVIKEQREQQQKDEEEEEQQQLAQIAEAESAQQQQQQLYNNNDTTETNDASAGLFSHSLVPNTNSASDATGAQSSASSSSGVANNSSHVSNAVPSTSSSSSTPVPLSSCTSTPSSVSLVGRSLRARLKLEAEQDARAREHARILLEQECYERKRVEDAAAKKAKLAKGNGAEGNNGAGANAGEKGNKEHADASGIPAEKGEDDEIEEEMLAAAEVERLRTVESVAGKLRAEAAIHNENKHHHTLSASISSCDLHVPSNNAASNSGKQGGGSGGTAPLKSAMKNTLLHKPSLATNMTSSFSSPHLSALADEDESDKQKGGAGNKNKSSGSGINHKYVVKNNTPKMMSKLNASSVFPFPPSSHSSSSHLLPDPALLSSGAKLSRIQREVAKLAREGTTHIVLLLSEPDYKEMGVDKMALVEAIKENGMKQLRVNVPQR